MLIARVRDLTAENATLQARLTRAMEHVLAMEVRLHDLRAHLSEVEAPMEYAQPRDWIGEDA